MPTETITANGIDFAYLEEGSSDGPLALCLHGFPDTAHTWRHLLPELAAAGFHAVAPFLRGYAPTPVAPDGHYQTGALVRDANALHEALGGDATAVIVGHDWGALATYGAVAHQPDRWNRAVALAVPPPGSMGAKPTGETGQYGDGSPPRPSQSNSVSAWLVTLVASCVCRSAARWQGKAAGESRP